MDILTELAMQEEMIAEERRLVCRDGYAAEDAVIEAASLTMNAWDEAERIWAEEARRSALAGLAL